MQSVEFDNLNFLSSPEASLRAVSSIASDEQRNYEQVAQGAMSPDVQKHIRHENESVGEDHRPLECLSPNSPVMTSRFLGDDEILQTSLKLFPYDSTGQHSMPYITYRRIMNRTASQNTSENNHVYFRQYDSSILKAAEPRPDISEMEKSKEEVQSLFTENQSSRLLKLFFDYVYPYFPVLSHSWFYSESASVISRIQALPLSLLSCVYATSLPFIMHDELLVTTLGHAIPDRTRLYRIAWTAITQELHAPHLATLQACLLMQQRGPTSSTIPATPFKDSLMGWTIGLAQSLGLSRDCSGWTSLPVWERRLRTRLWWAVFTMDSWISYGQGRPPMIHSSEYDVPAMLLPASADDVDSSIPSGTPPNCAHFYHLVRLSIIVSDIHEAYFSVRASATTSKNLHLSLDLARGFRARLTEWKQRFTIDCPRRPSSTVQTLSQSPNQLNANPSLELAYSVVSTTLFRALLRPLQNPEISAPSTHPITHDDARGAQAAIHTGALASAREAVEFLESIVLAGGTWNAFWHSWSQSNFALIGSFLVYLLLLRSSRRTTDQNHAEGGSTFHSQELIDVSSDPAKELFDLVKRWRWTLRIAGGSGGWGHTLTNLGLLRMEEFMVLLEKIQYRPQ
jgi:hypothetical protein